MKVFWSDREGNPPPHNATFGWRCFFPGSSLLESHKITQVKHLPPPSDPIQVVRRTLTPERKKWIEGIEKALSAIQRKELEKVVLARTCTLELSQEPDPFAIAAALRQKSQGAFVFCFQTSKTSFLGATPERLFVRKGRNIMSEAMAGTRRRGKNQEEDEAFKRELFSSPKELREFSPVMTYLQQTLSPLCRSPISFSPLSIHQTQNVQHLFSKCTGELKEKISDEEILFHLHPTPALCGTPKERAYSMIRELEPFQRGLYGGTLGWSTPEASEWVVGIRSCLIQGKTATLFSGTGIVEGSDPAAEWEELDHKLKLYDGIFI